MCVTCTCVSGTKLDCSVHPSSYIFSLVLPLLHPFLLFPSSSLPLTTYCRLLVLQLLCPPLPSMRYSLLIFAHSLTFSHWFCSTYIYFSLHAVLFPWGFHLANMAKISCSFRSCIQTASICLLSNTYSGHYQYQALGQPITYYCLPFLSFSFACFLFDGFPSSSCICSSPYP